MLGSKKIRNGGKIDIEKLTKEREKKEKLKKERDEELRKKERRAEEKREKELRKKEEKEKKKKERAAFKRIPLSIVPPYMAFKIAKKFRGMGFKFSSIFKSLDNDLKANEMGYDRGEFASICIVNGGAWFILFSVILFPLMYFYQSKAILESLTFSLLPALVIALMFFFVMIRYPTISSGKKAEKIDKNLVFVLKDLLLQVSSGVSLYNAMVNISGGGYGEVSKEFAKAVRRIDGGVPVDKSLERMAIESRSEYLRRSIWQVLNTIKAGASIKGSLRTIIDDLTLEQRSKIRDYAQELNLWSLIYMLFAVAIPTIGVTMLIILSSFAGIGITETTLIVFIIASFCVQFMLIGFVKSRRPVIEF
jgi:flagellar protein FlaJ